MFVRDENELLVEFGEPCPVLSPCRGEVSVSELTEPVRDSQRALTRPVVP